MGMKIIKVVESSFKGDDGKEIEGSYVYLVPADGKSGAQPERVFLSNDRLSGMGYAPKFGDTVYLFRNGYGRVIDILKV
ncbi:MAG: hypothetical protein VB071_07695 [Lawsonibacter sp.]|nr:hypothetical protein [Lawsonibacter sp.]